MPKFYRKELLQNTFYALGNPVTFTEISGSSGILELDETKDAALIAALDDAASKRRGGIVRIDAAQYADLKKNIVTPLHARQSRPVLRVFQTPGNQKDAIAKPRPASEKHKPVEMPPRVKPAPEPPKEPESSNPGKPLVPFVPPTGRKSGRPKKVVAETV